MGAEYLLERGFDHFAFAATTSTDRRVDAFQDVIESRSRRPCHILRAKWAAYAESSGDFARWLESLPKPIAIMATDDRIGRRVIERARELGLNVPNDVAVLGVRDDRWFTQVASIPMSSVETSDCQVGYRAAVMLDSLLAGETPPSPQLIPARGVVTRQSTDILLHDDRLVTEALCFIRDHCMERINVGDVLAHAGVSRRTLENRMQSAVGYTPKVAISRAVVRQAKKLLVDSNETINQISYACGFDRQEHFGALFKKHTGLTPGQYRQQHRLPYSDRDWTRASL
jgi:LacI family transcriptional regulator